MARRVGGAPSDVAWGFFEEALTTGYASGKIAIPEAGDKHVRDLRFRRRFHSIQMWKMWGGFIGLMIAVMADPWSRFGDIVFALLVGVVMVGSVWGVIWLVQRWVQWRSESKLSHMVAETIVQARSGDTRRLPDGAVPFAHAISSLEEAGLALDQRLPEEIDIAWDVDVVSVNRPRSAVEVDAAHFEKNSFRRHVLDRLAYRRFDIAGMVVSTAGGVVVGGVKAWPGIVGVNADGDVVDATTGAKDANRSTSVNMLIRRTQVVNHGDVAAVLVIVIGGEVNGGVIRTNTGGREVIVAELPDAIDALRELHLRGMNGVQGVVPMETVLSRSRIAESRS